MFPKKVVLAFMISIIFASSLFCVTKVVGTKGVNSTIYDDLVINNTRIINDTTIVINRSLVVEATGNLTLTNVTLLIGNNGWISVREGGMFTAKNSAFTTKPDVTTWCFLGLSSNSTVINCTFSNGAGISIADGSPYIADSTVSGTIWVKHFSAPIIVGNTITDGGVDIDSCANDELIVFENNTIMNSTNGLVLWFSSPTIINSTLINNEVGIYCHASSSTIINCTIASKKYDFYLDMRSHPKVSNTTFDENKVFFEDYESTLILPDTVLHKERDLYYYWYYYWHYIITIIAITVTLGIVAFLWKRKKKQMKV